MVIVVGVGEMKMKMEMENDRHQNNDNDNDNDNDSELCDENNVYNDINETYHHPSHWNQRIRKRQLFQLQPKTN